MLYKIDRIILAFALMCEMSVLNKYLKCCVKEKKETGASLVEALKEKG